MTSVRKIFDEIISKTINNIPKATYCFEQDIISSKYTIKLNNSGPLVNCHKYSNKFECFFIDSKSGSKVACVWIKNFDDPKYTFLYSHGGTIDLGNVINFLFMLSQRLTINVLLYDYSGFGETIGNLSEKAILQDSEAVYYHLTKTVIPSKIILYGQSMGTSLALHLATFIPNSAKALVLHSSYLSVRKLYLSNSLSKIYYFYDFFKNYEMIEQTELPLLSFHGTIDVISPFEHGKKIYALAKNKLRPCWIEGGGHDDLYAYDAYMKRLKRFIEYDLVN